MLAFKATRPDGTDFHTGTVKYEVGTTERKRRKTWEVVNAR